MRSVDFIRAGVQTSGTTEELAVYRYDDIRHRPAGGSLEVMTFLDVDPDSQPNDLQVVVGPSPEPSVIGAEGAAEAAAYYASFDGALRSLLGVTTLRWSASSESPVTR